MGIELYAHQEEMIQNVRRELATHKAVLLQAPTGSGKSVMASAMIAGSRAKGRKSAFVVPRIDLMKQMSNTFRDFDIPHSFIAQNESFNPKAHTHIASLGTLLKRMDKITPDVVFVDETHWGAGMIDRLIKYFKSRGVYVIGLSATPAMQNNFGMGDWYDAMVPGPSIRWLIDNKYLSDYALIHPSVKMGKGQIGGNPIEEWQKHAGGRLTIGFCRDKIHGMKAAEQFRNAGIPAAFIESETPPDERKRMIADLADHKIKILFNVYLCQMGFDLASQIGRKVNIRCMLDLQPTESLTSQMQKNGRALRYDDDGHAVIIDLAGNSYEENHGYPCADRGWVLDKSDQHKRDVEFRGRAESLVTCGSCYRPSKVGPMHCPHCGTQFVVDGKKVREVDGKLILITPEMLRAEKQDAKTQAKDERERKKHQRQERIAKNRELPPEKKKIAREKMVEALKNKGRTAYQIGIIINAEGLA